MSVRYFRNQHNARSQMGAASGAALFAGGAVELGGFSFGFRIAGAGALDPDADDVAFTPVGTTDGLFGVFNDDGSLAWRIHVEPDSVAGGVGNTYATRFANGDLLVAFLLNGDDGEVRGDDGTSIATLTRLVGGNYNTFVMRVAAGGQSILWQKRYNTSAGGVNEFCWPMGISLNEDESEAVIEVVFRNSVVGYDLEFGDGFSVTNPGVTTATDFFFPESFVRINTATGVPIAEPIANWSTGASINIGFNKNYPGGGSFKNEKFYTSLAMQGQFPASTFPRLGFNKTTPVFVPSSTDPSRTKPGAQVANFVTDELELAISVSGENYSDRGAAGAEADSDGNMYFMIPTRNSGNQTLERYPTAYAGETITASTITIIKVSPTGAILWQKEITHPFTGDRFMPRGAFSLSTDESRVRCSFTAGKNVGNVVFGPGEGNETTLVRTTNIVDTAYVFEMLTSDGTLQWAKQSGPRNTTSAVGMRPYPVTNRVAWGVTGDLGSIGDLVDFEDGVNFTRGVADLRYNLFAVIVGADGVTQSAVRLYEGTGDPSGVMSIEAK